MYGCALHSSLREDVIKKYGTRKGWENFGQWSIKKAQNIARKLTELNANNSDTESIVIFIIIRHGGQHNRL
jgi:hypothetical protein